MSGNDTRAAEWIVRGPEPNGEGAPQGNRDWTAWNGARELRRLTAYRVMKYSAGGIGGDGDSLSRLVKARRGREQDLAGRAGWFLDGQGIDGEGIGVRRKAGAEK